MLCSACPLRRNLRRPRKHVYSAKPTIGIRASKPNEIWHVDTTIIRLLDGVESLIEFYVAEHNTHLLHSAFRGQTPDEIYFDTNEGIPEQLKENRPKARSACLVWNQQATCERYCAQTASAN